LEELLEDSETLVGDPLSRPGFAAIEQLPRDRPANGETAGARLFEGTQDRRDRTAPARSASKGETLVGDPLKRPGFVAIGQILHDRPAKSIMICHFSESS